MHYFRIESISAKITCCKKCLGRKKTYTEIAEETKASTATISRVNRCLNYGADGYNNILNRLDEK